MEIIQQYFEVKEIYHLWFWCLV